MATVDVPLVKGADWVEVTTSTTFLAQNTSSEIVMVRFDTVLPTGDQPNHSLSPQEGVLRNVVGQPAGNLYAKSPEGGKITVSE